MADKLDYKIKKIIDRYFFDILIAILVIPFFLFLTIMPYKISSIFCGNILKFIGTKSKYQKRVLSNLKIAFPNKSDLQIKKLSKSFWFMFGQTIGEMPHISKMIKNNRVETIGLEKIKKGPAILVGAHLGNWELLLRVADLAGRRAGYVFRPINNWILNKLQIFRNKDANADFYKKGRVAALGMSNKLKNGEVIGLTNDQILREGILVPFFGKKTPTPQAAAIMSIKWNVPIYMVRVERFEGIKFKLTIENKIKIPKYKSKEKLVFEITSMISKRIEEWIIDKPEQWLWAHRRWGK